MQIMITDLSLYAKTILEQHSSWTVHSVYRKTINLQSGDLLLALQTAGSPLSPISLITDLSESGMDALKAVPGMEIPSSALQTDHANVRDLFLSPFSGSFGELSAAIHQTICQADDQGFRLLFLSDRQKNASLIMGAAKKSLTDCRLFLQKQETKAAAAALVRLTGLGIGLTPSGDDFLCGALAGLILTNSWNLPFTTALRQEIYAHLQDTNDISRAFLACALERQFSLPVVSLGKSSGAVTSDEILTSFSKIGHSSGIDTLCGIYYTLTCIAP